MKSKYLPTYISVVALVIAVVSFLVNSQQKDSTQRIAYVDLTKVYSQFEYTAEIKENINYLESKHQSQLDSIKMQIRLELDQEKVELLKRKYLEMAEYFSGQTTTYQSESEQKINAQLNQYAKEFGLQKKYNVLLGANGTGNIMFADSLLDVSTEFISYINQRYSNTQ